MKCDCTLNLLHLTIWESPIAHALIKIRFMFQIHKLLDMAFKIIPMVLIYTYTTHSTDLISDAAGVADNIVSPNQTPTLRFVIGYHNFRLRSEMYAQAERHLIEDEYSPSQR